MTETTTSGFVAGMNRDYERLHTSKEDAFWTAYMGLADDPEQARARLDEREIELSGFLRDPERLARVRAEIARAEKALDAPDDGAKPRAEDMLSLGGWLATLESHVIDSKPARDLADAIVEAEGALANARGKLELDYVDADGRRVKAGSVKLGTLLGTEPNENVRRSAWDGMRRIETYVLESGFIEVVKMRNRLGRMLGAEDYYDWKTKRVEGLSKREVFDLLSDLEVRTRTSARRSIDELGRDKGRDATKPWNLRFHVSGDVTTEQDPYFPFAKALERWGRSFAALGITYRGAELVLDLVDRKGKYENGFMHGPVPAWREPPPNEAPNGNGRWRPARIQFTANAIPGMLGSGRRATETLFHEGGHAAHFANIDMPSPCFSQEFAPTSVAFSETQSMFCDSLLSDADWQARYARTAGGERMSDALIEKGIAKTQPFAAWNLRAMCSVCFAERAIYEIPERELTPERVLDAIRDVERRLLFLDEGSPRPALSVPHLLAGESSAYYHGYVLADMAVHQTRAFFLERDGHLVDNPRIGPDLREIYWKPGNSIGFFDFVENLTGAPLTAEAIAREANRTASEALVEARAAIARKRTLPGNPGGPGGLGGIGAIDLDARIRVVHGRETVADSLEGGFEACARRFESWIDALVQRR